MSRLRTTRYTLVQHSAWPARQDPTFRNAVEPAGLSTHKELGQVIDAGGLVFDDYKEADDAADRVNQPALDPVLFRGQATPDATPADLTFDEKLAIGGRALYLPSESTATAK